MEQRVTLDLKKMRHTSVVTIRAPSLSSRGESVTTYTAWLLRGGCSHVSVHAHLWSNCAEKSVEMHISSAPKVA